MVFSVRLHANLHEVSSHDASVYHILMCIDETNDAGGNEAVEFFQRSGLSKEPLYQVHEPDCAAVLILQSALYLRDSLTDRVSVLQIWNVVANNNPYLSKQQFYTAMRLVSAAQVFG